MRLGGYWATGLLGGRPPQPGVATEQSVLAWQLYYVDVFYISYQNKPPKYPSGLPALTVDRVC